MGIVSLGGNWKFHFCHLRTDLLSTQELIDIFWDLLATKLVRMGLITTLNLVLKNGVLLLLLFVIVIDYKIIVIGLLQ